MKGLKDFRRSLNKDRTSGGKPTGLSPTTGAAGGFTNPAAPSTFTNVKNAVTIQPPKMVIKAMEDYRSRAPQELSFHRGDFFHVISDPAPNAEWFEACNPITNARGLVPAGCFEVLGRQARPGQAGAGAGAGGMPASRGAASPVASGSQNNATTAQRVAGADVTAKGGGGLYAHVKYDFDAERADELGAKAGEPIIVMAQSNFEWFVAKPIGRLGGPGLIPVAFVEIKDLATGQAVGNVDELISAGVIPNVEDWKKMTADYKKNTIPLGRFDFGKGDPSAVGGAGAGLNDVMTPPRAIGAGGDGEESPRLPPKDGRWGNNEPARRSDYGGGAGEGGMPPSQPSTGNMDYGPGGVGADELPPGMPPGEPLPAGIINQATVDSFHYEQGDYWFRIQATHIAGGSATAPPTAPRAPDGEERDLILYRLYEDFYEFQIALLDHFPAEAGRQIGPDGSQSKRILPLMPGPLDKVDDYITAQRRGDLDQYIVELCALPEYILRSELVRLFFEPRPGDHCTAHPVPPLAASSSQRSMGSQQQHPSQQFDRYGERVEEVRSPMPPTAAAPPVDSGYSNGTSRYAEDQPAGVLARNVSSGSRATGPGGPGELPSRFESLSMRSSGVGSRGSEAVAGSGMTSSSSHSQQLTSSNTPSLQPPAASMQRNHSNATLGSQRDSRGSTGTGANSGSLGGGSTLINNGGSMGSHNTNSNHSGGANSSTPSFIKIKIFSRSSDDLVAIRVPPTVSHDALLDKIRDRLGPEINVLRYREISSSTEGAMTGGGAGGGVMVRIHDEEDLREWLGSGAKLVLYADKN